MEKYKINKTFFDIIDSEEKAYILGLLYADGWTNGATRISIALNEKDKDLLEQAKSYIQPDRSLSLLKKQKEGNSNQYRWTIDNKYMVNAVKALGIVPRKSLTMKFPTYIEHNLLNHFIRGYFDGDGSIYQAKKNDYAFNVCGTYDFILNIQNILINKLEVSNVKIQPNGNIFMITYSGNLQVAKIMNWLYKDSTICMKRKFDRYETLKELNYNRKMSKIR